MQLNSENTDQPIGSSPNGSKPFVGRSAASINRINDFIDGLALQANRHLDRELVWVKNGNIWVALQDCLNDPYIKRDVACYDEDLFLVHLLESKENPNDDYNVPYRSRWGTFDLSKWSISKAVSEFCRE